MTDLIRDDYLILKDATKFIGQLQITLSILQILSSIAVISVYSIKINYCDECEHPLSHQHMIGLVAYSSAVLLINFFDIVTAFFLISGSNNLNISRCEYWCLLSETTLMLFSIVTFIFMFILEDGLLFLALVPNLLLKPLGLWIVKGFIFKLQQIYARQKIYIETDFSSGSSSASPHSTSSNTSIKTKSHTKSLSKTTVFILNRKDNPGTVHSYQKIPQ